MTKTTSTKVYLTTTTYSIDDGHGQQITTGLQGYDAARAVAQRLADERGESVYLYSDDHDSESEEVGPTTVEV